MKNVQRISGFKAAPSRSISTRCGQHKIHWFRMKGTDGVVPFVDDLVLTTESQLPFIGLTPAGNRQYAFKGLHEGTLVFRGVPMRWPQNETASVEPWLLDLFERGIMTGEAL